MRGHDRSPLDHFRASKKGQVHLTKMEVGQIEIISFYFKDLDSKEAITALITERDEGAEALASPQCSRTVQGDFKQ